jgi:hypothetical protein
VAGVRSGENPMKLYCSKCQELYDYNVPGGNYIDGAFFGTTFPHLFFQTYRELRPPPCSTKYVPRVFGFKVHKARRPRGRAPSPRKFCSSPPSRLRPSSMARGMVCCGRRTSIK